MLLNFFGRIFFPRLQPWERRRKLKMLVGTILTACFFAACVGVMIYKQNSVHR